MKERKDEDKRERWENERGNKVVELLNDRDKKFMCGIRKMSKKIRDKHVEETC